jgi:hypothetical protein
MLCRGDHELCAAQIPWSLLRQSNSVCRLLVVMQLVSSVQHIVCPSTSAKYGFWYLDGMIQ